MTKILIVEDDKTIASAIQIYLVEKGYETMWADTIQKAKQHLNHQIDLILLDYNLPDGNGELFCKHINDISDIPIIFLTVNDNEADIIRCLNVGGDDYIIKPFKLSIMFSRINAVLRRSKINNTNIVVCDEITLTKDSGKVFCRDKEVQLTAIEYRLILLLMENRKHILTRTIILEKLWDNSGNFVNNNTLTVTMKRLREKLEFPTCIKTIRGVGYRMEESNNDD